MKIFVYGFWLLLLFTISSKKILSQNCDPINDKPNYDLAFEQPSIEYQFLEGDLNKKVLMIEGFWADTTCGRIKFFVPIEPIELATNTSLINSQGFEQEYLTFIGHFSNKAGFPIYDFPYLRKKEVQGARINGSLFSKNFSSHFKAVVFINNVYTNLRLDITIPLELTDFGFDTSKFSVESLKNEFKVRIIAIAEPN